MLTDEEGDFALPFRWPPQSTATTEVVEAGDQWVPVGRLRGLLQAEVIIANETFRVVEVDAGNMRSPGSLRRHRPVGRSGPTCSFRRSG